MEMFLAIISLLVTIIFGILSIDLFKRKKRPCKITYYPSEAINLYRNLAKGFDNLEILKDKEPIANNIVFISGIIVSNGDLDITGKDNNVNLDLPEGCKWIDLKKDTQSKGFNPSFSICKDNPQTAVFCFDLFRINEFVKFQALIEYENKDLFKSPSKIHDKISFNHRIENTIDVKKGEIIRKRIKNEGIKSAIIPLLLFCLTVFVSFFFFNGSSQITYIDRNNKHECYATVNNNNKVDIRDVNALNLFWPYSKTEISSNEFERNYKPIYKYRFFNENSIPSAILVCIIMLMFILTFVIVWYIKRRNNRLYDLFGISENDETISEI